MRIGLIADTHLRDRTSRLAVGWAGGLAGPAAAEGRRSDDVMGGLAPDLERVFAGVDLIVHAGDVVVPAVLDWLERLAPVVCALGNGDHAVRVDPRVRRTQLLELEGVILGVTHGLDYPLPDARTIERAMQHEFGRRVDVYVSGHTHVPVAERIKGVLVVNPGSPTQPRGRFGAPGTVAVLTLAGASPEVTLMPVRLR